MLQIRSSLRVHNVQRQFVSVFFSHVPLCLGSTIGIGGRGWHELLSRTWRAPRVYAQGEVSRVVHQSEQVERRHRWRLLARRFGRNLARCVVAHGRAHLLKEKQAAGLKRDILDLREACWAVQREPLHLLTVFRLAHIDVGFGQMFFECGYSKREICASFGSSIVVSFCFSCFF